jgi:hypothetical protein
MHRDPNPYRRAVTERNVTRSDARARVRQQLLALIERSHAPDEVRGFLLDRWAELLTDISATRGESHPDWAAGWDTVHGLLWSLEPKYGLDDARRLLGVLPLLVERLHDGCQALRLENQICDKFFAELAMLHAAIVRSGLHANDADGPIAPTLANVEADGFGPFVTAPASRVTTSPSTRIDPTKRLEVGARLAFLDGAAEKYLGLQWISPMRGMFLFTDERGYEALSLTRAKLVEKLERGEARLVV